MNRISWQQQLLDITKEKMISTIPEAEPLGPSKLLDVMVIVDMVLNRQDCCSYYYGGTIY